MQMRLLDKVKWREEKLFWQLVNILLPVMIILMGGFIFWFIRRKKYARRD